MIFLAPQQKSPAARGECVCGRCGYTGSHFHRPPRRRQGTHGPFSQRAETALEFEHRALASEQPSLGQHCSPPLHGEGPHKSGPKNCLSHTPWPASRGWRGSLPAVQKSCNKKEDLPSTLAHGTCAPCWTGKGQLAPKEDELLWTGSYPDTKWTLRR